MLDKLKAAFSPQGSVKAYCESEGLFNLLGEPIHSGTEAIDLTATVDVNNNTPYPPDFGDLSRLHYLVRSRRATTVLEFGVGKSTLVLADALYKNRMEYGDEVGQLLRRTNPFQLFVVDNDSAWLERTREHVDKVFSNVTYTCSPCDMSTFNGRICTYYRSLPNISPDFIYLDGPSQFGVNGCIRGICTNHKDRMPMSADILAIEHFLVPGTLLVVDGRGANARFLKCNLQRQWMYSYDAEFDQHFFELNEDPLGPINRSFLQFQMTGEIF